LPLKSGDDQLDSGHIFKVGNEWWVCATPACDLQPGQNTIAFIGSDGNQRPFVALKLLVQENLDLSAKEINSGLHCFVEREPGEVICLSLEDLGAGKVTWRTFLALKNGHIVCNDMTLITPKFKDGALKLEEVQGKVVAKLRYEYALNYIQKVGVSVTRIGLGYLS